MESKDVIIIIAIILFTFGAGILSAYQYYDGAKKDKQNDLLNNALQTSQAKIIEEQQKNNQKADELVDVYKKLDIANEEIKKVQEETINLLTGGPSFGHFVAVGITEATTGSFSLNFINRGDFQLYDVTANIIDYMILYNPEIAKLPVTEENMRLWRKLVDVKVSKPNSIAPYGTYSFKDTNRLEFIAEIWARNGHFQQRLKLYFKNGKWLRANQVIKWITDSDKESPILLEEVDKDFPRLTNGKVDWDNYNPYKPL